MDIFNEQQNDLTPEEFAIYDNFLQSWIETSKVVGDSTVVDLFNDRTKAFHTIFPEVLNAVNDETIANKIATKLVNDLPNALTSTISLSLKVGPGTKFAVIDKENGEYVVKTKDRSRELGKHKTKEDAVKQLQAIEISKHSNMQPLPKNEDYHPGSNTGGVNGPRQMPKHPGDLSRGDRQDNTNYFTPSFLERDFEEEHPSPVDRGSGPDAQSGGGAQSVEGIPGQIDDPYPGVSNKLRKKKPRQNIEYQVEFNTGFDTPYTQRQFGLSLRKLIKKATLSLRKIAIDDEGLYHLRALLSNGHTTEDMLWNLVQTYSDEVDVLTEIIGHPNFKDPQKRNFVWNQIKNLDNLNKDNKYVDPYESGDLSDILEGSNPLDAQEADTGGVDTQDLLDDVDPKSELAERLWEQSLHKFKPDKREVSDTVPAPIERTGDESAMLENSSQDEIWELAQQGDPTAQSLIQKGIVATLKIMRKRALLDWTDLADDLLTFRNTQRNAQARKLLTLIKQEAQAGNLNDINDFSKAILNNFPEYKGNTEQLQRLYNRLIDLDYLQEHDDIIDDNVYDNDGNKYDPYKFGEGALEDEELPTPAYLNRRSPRFTEFNRGNDIPLASEIEPINDEKVSWWKRLFSSVIDAPRGVMDPAIWQDSPINDSVPMLKPEVKIEIVKRFYDYISRFGGYIRPELWVKNMFYTGSTATYNYNNTSDVDIHVIVDWHDMLTMNPDKKHKDLEEVWRDLHDTFWYTLNQQALDGTKHPIQYYVLKPGDEHKIVDQKEEIYDIGHDTWLIPPSKNSEVPEDVLEAAAETSGEIMNRIDQQIADARKGLIDYALLLEIITPENAKDIYGQLSQKIREIDKSLVEMKEEYKRLKDKRTDAFVENTVDNNFSLNNVIFKFVERYKYMDTLRKIKSITDGMELTPDEIPDVADALKLEDLFDQEQR